MFRQVLAISAVGLLVLTAGCGDLSAQPQTPPPLSIGDSNLSIDSALSLAEKEGSQYATGRDEQAQIQAAAYLERAAHLEAASQAKEAQSFYDLADKEASEHARGKDAKVQILYCIVDDPKKEGEPS